MAISFDDYITIISLGISAVSLSVVIFLSYSWGKRLNTEYHNVSTSPAPSDNEVEVSAVVSEFTQRLRKLEESLVDQKVKFEILELRATRANRDNTPQSYQRTTEELPPTPVENTERPSPPSPEVSGMRMSPQNAKPELDKKLGTTEVEALRLVFEGRGKVSAKEIQQRIGRTREHTARMMNALYHDGLVSRDVTARPFSYSITEKGRDVLNG